MSPDLDDLGHLGGSGGGLEHEQEGGGGGGDDKGQPGKKRRNRKVSSLQRPNRVPWLTRPTPQPVTCARESAFPRLHSPAADSQYPRFVRRP